MAAIHGRSDCLQELAKVVDEWNCKSILGETPLYAALYIGHPESVRIIVSQPGVDFSVKTNDGKTLTEAAVTSFRRDGKCVECVKNLAEGEAVDWNVKMKNGDTPIMHCLKENKKEMFNVLAECPRVDINIVDEDGNSPIMWCLKNGRLLDKHGVLLNSPRVDLSSAITWAAKKKDLVIMKELRQALEYRLAEAKRRLKTSWRGRGGPGTGVLMMDEMAVIKLRSQLNLCRGFSEAQGGGIG